MTVLTEPVTVNITGTSSHIPAAISRTRRHPHGADMAMPGSRLWSTLYGFLALPVFGLLLAVASRARAHRPRARLRRELIRRVRPTRPDGARPADRGPWRRITFRPRASSWRTTPATSTGSSLRPCCRRGSRSSSSAKPRRFRSRACCCAGSAPSSSTAAATAAAERCATSGAPAEAGHSLVFFPEGTFVEEPGLRRSTSARSWPQRARSSRRAARHPRRASLDAERRDRAARRSHRGRDPRAAPSPGLASAADELRREARRQMLTRLDEPDVEAGAGVPVPEATGT